MPSSYPVVPHAVSVSAGMIVAVPLELLASPLKSGRDLGDADRSALVNNLLGLIVVAVLVAYFYYCAIIEERNLTATFPQAYPEYTSRTKMLIPFVR